jgi:hypothetical protein
MKQTIAWMLLASLSISLSVQPNNFVYSDNADSDSCLIAAMQDGRPDSIIMSPVTLDINYRKITMK